MSVSERRVRCRAVTSVQGGSTSKTARLDAEYRLAVSATRRSASPSPGTGLRCVADGWLVFLGAGAGILGQAASACQAQPAAGTGAAGIPAACLADYQKAGARYGIPWTVLAGIGEVESDQGRSDAPGVHSGANPAGAAGPMQFGIGGLAGNTWGGAPVHPASEHTGGYGIDGDHDGIVDVYDPGDAIPSAAAFLKANGAPASTQAALFAYKHSDGYVTEVLAWAARYGAGGTAVLTTEQDPVCEQADLGPLPAGTAGKVIAYAEAHLASPTCGAPPAPTPSIAPGSP
jgi:peptidoglycan DL-endopeptidase CwlO